MNTALEKPHLLKTIRSLWMGVLLCALVGAICFIGGRFSAVGADSAPTLSAVVLKNQLSDLQELSTVSYAYTNMAQFESSNDFYGVKLPFTTKSFILTYDGTIKAGIDLADATVDVSGTQVHVTLPQAKILSHEIDEESVEVFDEKTALFNPFTVEDFTAFQSDQQRAMETRALSRGLLDEAQQRAETGVRALLESALPEDCTLTVE